MANLPKECEITNYGYSINQAHNVIAVPQGAIFRFVDVVANNETRKPEIRAYYEINPQVSGTETHEFFVFGTGANMNILKMYNNYEYKGSVRKGVGLNSYMFHVYEVEGRIEIK